MVNQSVLNVSVRVCPQNVPKDIHLNVNRWARAIHTAMPMRIKGIAVMEESPPYLWQPQVTASLRFIHYRKYAPTISLIHIGCYPLHNAITN